METGRCVDCGGQVKTAGRERCVSCANKKRAAEKRALRPLCVACKQTQVARRNGKMCHACWLEIRGHAATAEGEAARVAKIVASGIGKYERTPEIREKYAAAKRGRKVPSTSRERHWKWNGGFKRDDGNGYVGVLCDDGKYRKEHRLVMEREIGRALLTSEEVHHINGVRNDNRIENLYLVQTKVRHRELHASLQRAGFAAVQAGLIVFEDGDYRIQETT